LSDGFCYLRHRQDLQFALAQRAKRAVGKRLVVELWERLRDEAVFDSEEALVAQIARDVEATRAATRPV
jgi:FAD synthase